MTDMHVKAPEVGPNADALTSLTRGRGPRRGNLEDCGVGPYKIGPNKGQPRTGTNAGYNAHKKDGTEPCSACREAHNEYVREYNSRTGSGRKATKKFRETHPERVREQEARYWAKNHDKKLAKQARYRETHRAELSAKGAVYVHRRRARKQNAPVGQPYTKAEIFDRDNWTCQICNEAIDPNLSWPDRMSASIDHIKEIYKGGADCATNVRSTHLTCNLSRSRA